MRLKSVRSQLLDMVARKQFNTARAVDAFSTGNSLGRMGPRQRQPQWTHALPQLSSDRAAAASMAEVLAAEFKREVGRTAILASNPVRNPYWLSSRSASKMGPITSTTAIMTTRSRMLALLSETTVLYAHLARSIMKQRGDREARQIAVDAMAASIAHEVNQPVTAITFNCDAALDLLAKTPPNIHEACGCRPGGGGN